MTETKRALITGISGGLARLVGRMLYDQGFEIVGVDYRRAEVLDFPAQLYRANYNKTKIEDIFRRHPPTHVLHLGRVGNLKHNIDKRFDLNVMGSRKVMELSERYKAHRMVVLSTFHIYGAHPHNHVPIFEDEPLRAGPEFPQIADAIQLDNQAITFAYQHPALKTAILRPTNVVGPDIANAMSSFLRQRRVPVIMGFDPMTQFVHQQDLAEALVRMTNVDAVGVFNVCGPRAVPWRSALVSLHKELVPIPSTLAFAYLRLAGLVSRTLPPYLVNFFKYPCVISDQKLRDALGWAPTVQPEEALLDTVRGQPAPLD